MSLFEFWKSQKEGGALLRRANQLRLPPSQLKRLLGDSAVRSEIHGVTMASLLPPVGTEVFRRFTVASLEEIKQRQHAENMERQKRKKKEVEEKDRPKQATHLEAGKPLPFIYGDPSPELLSTPLEELDPFYQSQKTFIVLSKGNLLHRFNAESACFLLSPFSPVRTTAIRILTHSLFSLFIMLTILTNCVFMTITFPSPWSKTAECLFTAVYVLEVIIKIMSRGFCIGRFTFLRDAWNWLDVMVITTTVLTEFVYLEKLCVVRTVPRVLKIISVYPGVKTTAGALVQSVKRLSDVIILTGLVLSVLAVIGLDFFMGTLKHKCVQWPTNLTEVTFKTYINNASNQYFLPGESDALLCGNNSDGVCPEGFTCFKTLNNPNYGYTSYDDIGRSLLAVLKLFTRDDWVNLVLKMLRVANKATVILFIPIIFVSSFIIHSLILAVVAIVSIEQDKADIAKAKQKEEEFLQIKEVMKRREEEDEGELCVKQQLAPQKKNSATVIKSHSLGELEDQTLCPPCCLTFLRWNCCGCWQRLKCWFSAFVTNPFFDLGIVICLVLNCIFIGMEHYPMTQEFEELLYIMHLVFTAIFTVEMLLRIVAMDPYSYFQEGWNVFDSIVVTISLVELSMADIEGLSVLRCFRVMRVIRVARWWPTFHMLIKIMWSSVRALRNLTLIFLVMVFLFTVVGMQLFRKDYQDHVCRITSDCELPRWHMHHLFHTFVLVFRVLCGQWTETMWDCMEVSGQTTCLIFFMAVLVIGHLLVLNLFLTLLLSSANGNNLVAPTEKRKDNLQVAINRIKVCAVWTRTWILERMWSLCGKKKHINPEHKVVDSDKDKKEENLSLTFVTTDQSVSQTPENKEEENKEEEKKQHNEDEDTPQDCCCYSCYRCCSFLDVNVSQGRGRVWSNFRRACFSIVQHKYFETFIIFIILLSSAALVLEDIHLQQRHVLLKVLDTADQVFTYLFFLEMLLKWIAYGFKKYFTNTWCWLDFLILAVSLISLTGEMLGCSEMRTLRAVRPLRALSRFQGMRVVCQALVVTLPSMLDALLVAQIVWFIFSIIGVNLFAGKFFFCFNGTEERQFLSTEVNNKTECFSLIMENFTEVRWRSTKQHFDSVGAGYLSLLHVATFSGWLEIMYSAVDATQVESQPVYESNVHMYLYFIFFIIIGIFFTLNLFIRVFINRLVKLRYKFGGKLVLKTEQQQKLCRRLNRLVSSKDQRPVPRPQTKCQALLFDLVTKPSFEVFMFFMICLNMVVLMVETDQQSMEKEEILHWLHFTFNIIFLTEFLLKIIALRQHYFSNCLNVLDLVIITVSTVGIFFSDVLEKYLISITNLPVLRLARINRIIYLIPGSQGIRKLHLAFRMSLPALFNICLLIFFLMFTFSIFGMLRFAYVKKETVINDMMNFETFVNSMMCLFTMTTMTGWDGLLRPILSTPPDCDPLSENPGFLAIGDCGSSTEAIVFFTSYIILYFVLLVHMYLAVVLETLNMNETKELSDNDLQMFYDTWRKFDPDTSQIIQYSQLSDLCDSLQDPLRIPKPNTSRLIHMDLPLLPGDQIYCLDILLALTAQLLGDSGEKNMLKARMEEKFTTKTKVLYKPISSTLRRRQEEVAAVVIQRAYRKHLQDRGGGQAAGL